MAENEILVTGGNGFIGSHLVDRLSTQFPDFLLHIIDTESSFSSKKYIFECPNCVRHVTDITDFKALEFIMSDLNPSFVFHLAAITDVGRNVNEAKLIDVNVNGTKNLYLALQHKDIKSFVHMGTSECYGNNSPPFREDMTVDPVSLYSESKISSEAIAKEYSSLFNIPTVFVRSFNVYGEGQETGMIIPYVIGSCLLGNEISATKGEQTREYNHVSDIVDGLILSAEVDRAWGEIINLGCGFEISIKELITKIVDKIDKSLKINFGVKPYRENEIWRMFCDNSKAKRILKWEPKIDLDTGLNQTIKWYKANI